MTCFRRIPPRGKEGAYFSVHDLEGTTPRIVLVNTGGHKDDEVNFGDKQKAVGKERRVRPLNHACLQCRYPYSSPLRVNVSIRLAGSR
jgi:hypothetical protein